MSKFKDVTDNQGLGFARMARAKGVSCQRFAAAEEDGTLGRFLDGIKAGLPITVGVLAPPGAQVHIVKLRNLRLDREWQEAVDGAGPDTTRDSNVRKVGDLYPPAGVGVISELHILFSHSNNRSDLDGALVWAAQYRLVPNDPRRVFEMARRHPRLNRVLEMNRVVAPVICEFEGGQRACYARWENYGSRGASLGYVNNLHHSTDWFSFRLPVPESK